MMDRIALLLTESRESASKAANLANAAARAGIAVSRYVNCDGRELVADLQATHDNIVGVVACSDGVILAALYAERAFGLIGGYDEWAFQSKSASYALFRRSGFATLNHHEVCNVDQIAHSPIRGPIFVKPRWSSGVYSSQPWNYRAYNSKDDLLAYLRANDLTASFADSIIMDHVPHDGVYCFSALLREDKAVVFGQSFMKISGEDFFYDFVHYDESYIPPEIEAKVQNLWAQGYRSHFLYLQCLKVGDKLYPMDANTRISTYLDSLVSAYDPEFYDRALAFIIGKSDTCDLRLPAKHTLIGRIKTNPHIETRSIGWRDLPGVRPLNFHDLGRSRAAFDVAHSWPTFVVQGESAEEVLTKRETFMAGVRVTQ